jgi:hypothetical protein
LGDVVLDDMSGKTPAGNEWKTLLIRQHAKFKKFGCPYTKIKFTQVDDSITFEDSKHLSLIQVADIVSYNTMRQFRDHGAIWDDPKARRLPLYSYFGKLLPKFDKSNVGIFAGYGVAKMPRIGSNRWLVPAQV